MTDLRQAAQQALEALQKIYIAPEHDEYIRVWWPACDESITALRAALAEPVQEPVAWMIYTLDGKSVCVTDNPADFTEQHKALPLYTAPPQRKPLSEEWVRSKCKETWVFETVMRWVRAIERAHGIV